MNLQQSIGARLPYPPLPALPPAPKCVLPHEDMGKFLLEVIEQTNFPGKMAEYVAHVKLTIKHAEIYKG